MWVKYPNSSPQNDKDATLSTHCTYHYLKEGVHVYTFLQAKRTAVDHLVEHIATVFEHSDADAFTRHVVVCHVGVPPLSYLFRKTAEMAKHYPNRRTRFAIVYKDSRLIDLASAFINTQLNRQSEVRFFEMRKYPDALLWARD